MGGGGSKQLDPNKVLEVMEQKSQKSQEMMMDFFKQMQNQNQATMNMVCGLVLFYILFSENI